MSIEERCEHRYGCCLQACGFKLVFQEGGDGQLEGSENLEGFAILPEHADLAPLQAALQLLGHQEPAQQPCSSSAGAASSHSASSSGTAGPHLFRAHCPVLCLSALDATGLRLGRDAQVWHPAQDEERQARTVVMCRSGIAGALRLCHLCRSPAACKRECSGSRPRGRQSSQAAQEHAGQMTSCNWGFPMSKELSVGYAFTRGGHGHSRINADAPFWMQVQRASQ